MLTTPNFPQRRVECAGGENDHGQNDHQFQTTSTSRTQYAGKSPKTNDTNHRGAPSAPSPTSGKRGRMTIEQLSEWAAMPFSKAIGTPKRPPFTPRAKLPPRPSTDVTTSAAGEGAAMTHQHTRAAPSPAARRPLTPADKPVPESQTADFDKKTEPFDNQTNGPAALRDGIAMNNPLNTTSDTAIHSGICQGQADPPKWANETNGDYNPTHSPLSRVEADGRQSTRVDVQRAGGRERARRGRVQISIGGSDTDDSCAAAADVTVELLLAGPKTSSDGKDRTGRHASADKSREETGEGAPGTPHPGYTRGIQSSVRAGLAVARQIAGEKGERRPSFGNVSPIPEHRTGPGRAAAVAKPRVPIDQSLRALEQMRLSKSNRDMMGGPDNPEHDHSDRDLLPSPEHRDPELPHRSMLVKDYTSARSDPELSTEQSLTAVRATSLHSSKPPTETMRLDTCVSTGGCCDHRLEHAPIRPSEGPDSPRADIAPSAGGVPRGDNGKYLTTDDNAMPIQNYSSFPPDEAGGVDNAMPIESNTTDVPRAGACEDQQSADARCAARTVAAGAKEAADEDDKLLPVSSSDKKKKKDCGGAEGTELAAEDQPLPDRGCWQTSSGDQKNADRGNAECAEEEEEDDTTSRGGQHEDQTAGRRQQSEHCDTRGGKTAAEDMTESLQCQKVHGDNGQAVEAMRGRGSEEHKKDGRCLCTYDSIIASKTRADKQKADREQLKRLQTPLTTEALNAAEPTMQKKMLGEHLYPRVANRAPEQAGKITGGMLHNDNEELLRLLSDPGQLDKAIDDAVAELKHKKQDTATRMLQYSKQYILQNTPPQHSVRDNVQNIMLRRSRVEQEVKCRMWRHTLIPLWKTSSGQRGLRLRPNKEMARAQEMAQKQDGLLLLSAQGDARPQDEMLFLNSNDIVTACEQDKDDIVNGCVLRMEDITEKQRPMDSADRIGLARPMNTAARLGLARPGGHLTQQQRQGATHWDSDGKAYWHTPTSACKGDETCTCLGEKAAGDKPQSKRAKQRRRARGLMGMQTPGGREQAQMRTAQKTGGFDIDDSMTLITDEQQTEAHDARLREFGRKLFPDMRGGGMVACQAFAANVYMEDGEVTEGEACTHAAADKRESPASPPTTSPSPPHGQHKVPNSEIQGLRHEGLYAVQRADMLEQFAVLEVHRAVEAARATMHRWLRAGVKVKYNQTLGSIWQTLARRAPQMCMGRMERWAPTNRRADTPTQVQAGAVDHFMDDVLRALDTFTGYWDSDGDESEHESPAHLTQRGASLSPVQFSDPSGSSSGSGTEEYGNDSEEYINVVPPETMSSQAPPEPATAYPLKYTEGAPHAVLTQETGGEGGEGEGEALEVLRTSLAAEGITMVAGNQPGPGREGSDVPNEGKTCEITITVLNAEGTQVGTETFELNACALYMYSDVHALMITRRPLIWESEVWAMALRIPFEGQAQLVERRSRDGAGGLLEIDIDNWEEDSYRELVQGVSGLQLSQATSFRAQRETMMRVGVRFMMVCNDAQRDWGVIGTSDQCTFVIKYEQDEIVDKTAVDEAVLSHVILRDSECVRLKDLPHDIQSRMNAQGEGVRAGRLAELNCVMVHIEKYNTQCRVYDSHGTQLVIRGMTPQTSIGELVQRCKDIQNKPCVTAWLTEAHADGTRSPPMKPEFSLEHYDLHTLPLQCVTIHYDQVMPRGQLDTQTARRTARASGGAMGGPPEPEQRPAGAAKTWRETKRERQDVDHGELVRQRQMASKARPMTSRETEEMAGRIQTKRTPTMPLRRKGGDVVCVMLHNGTEKAPRSDDATTHPAMETCEFWVFGRGGDGPMAFQRSGQHALAGGTFDADLGDVTLEDTVVREIREETGLELDTGRVQHMPLPPRVRRVMEAASRRHIGVENAATLHLFAVQLIHGEAPDVFTSEHAHAHVSQMQLGVDRHMEEDGEDFLFPHNFVMVLHFMHALGMETRQTREVQAGSYPTVSLVTTSSGSETQDSDSYEGGSGDDDGGGMGGEASGNAASRGSRPRSGGRPSRTAKRHAATRGKDEEAANARSRANVDKLQSMRNGAADPEYRRAQRAKADEAATHAALRTSTERDEAMGKEVVELRRQLRTMHMRLEEQEREAEGTEVDEARQAAVDIRTAQQQDERDEASEKAMRKQSRAHDRKMAKARAENAKLLRNYEALEIKFRDRRSEGERKQRTTVAMPNGGTAKLGPLPGNVGHVEAPTAPAGRGARQSEYLNADAEEALANLHTECEKEKAAVRKACEQQVRQAKAEAGRAEHAQTAMAVTIEHDRQQMQAAFQAMQTKMEDMSEAVESGSEYPVFVAALEARLREAEAKLVRESTMYRDMHERTSRLQQGAEAELENAREELERMQAEGDARVMELTCHISQIQEDMTEVASKTMYQVRDERNRFAADSKFHEEIEEIEQCYRENVEAKREVARLRETLTLYKKEDGINIAGMSAEEGVEKLRAGYSGAATESRKEYQANVDRLVTDIKEKQLEGDELDVHVGVVVFKHYKLGQQDGRSEDEHPLEAISPKDLSRKLSDRSNIATAAELERAVKGWMQAYPKQLAECLPLLNLIVSGSMPRGTAEAPFTTDIKGELMRRYPLTWAAYSIKAERLRTVLETINMELIRETLAIFTYGEMRKDEFQIQAGKTDGVMAIAWFCAKHRAFNEDGQNQLQMLVESVSVLFARRSIAKAVDRLRRVLYVCREHKVQINYIKVIRAIAIALCKRDHMTKEKMMPWTEYEKCEAVAARDKVQVTPTHCDAVMEDFLRDVLTAETELNEEPQPLMEDAAVNMAAQTYAVAMTACRNMLPTVAEWVPAVECYHGQVDTDPMYLGGAHAARGKTQAAKRAADVARPSRADKHNQPAKPQWSTSQGLLASMGKVAVPTEENGYKLDRRSVPEQRRFRQVKFTQGKGGTYADFGDCEGVVHGGSEGERTQALLGYLPCKPRQVSHTACNGWDEARGKKCDGALTQQQRKNQIPVCTSCRNKWRGSGIALMHDKGKVCIERVWESVKAAKAAKR